MIKTNTIQFKIGVLYLVILGLILLAYSTVLYSSLQHTLYRYIDHELQNKVEETRDLLDSFMRPPAGYLKATLQVASTNIILHQNLSYTKKPITTLEARIMEVLDKYELRDDYVVLTTPSEPVVSSNVSPGMLRVIQSQKLPLGKTFAFHSFHYNEKPLRMISQKVILNDGSLCIIQIATSTRDISQAIRKLLYLIILTIPVMLILAGSTGRWLVSGILHPVAAIAKTAEKISHEDLSTRVKIQDVDEEMQYLVQAFNHMIERLEKSFNHISEFSAHVAHELKTPLAVIRGECEVALRKEREGGEYKQALEANLRESQRMIRIVEDMLLLSRLDYEVPSHSFVPLAVEDLVREIFEKAKILAEDKNIRVVLSGNADRAKVRGDALHLRRLFLNLVDNAIKFSGPGSELTLRTEKFKDHIHISVADQGPGIPESDLPKIFEKFFHRDKPGKNSGNGLGLSIALAIARAHQGDIQVRSRLGLETTFTVSLPLLY